jgi:hypothetical protein
MACCKRFVCQNCEKLLMHGMKETRTTLMTLARNSTLIIQMKTVICVLAMTPRIFVWRVQRSLWSTHSHRRPDAPIAARQIFPITST